MLKEGSHSRGLVAFVLGVGMAVRGCECAKGTQG